MRKIFLFCLLLSNFHSAICQDIIVFKNGDELKVSIIEVLPDLVKYKKWDNQNGPQYSESKGNIFMIKYQNGTKDVFSNQATNVPPVSTEESIKTEAFKKLERIVANDYNTGKISQVIKFISLKKTNGVMQNVAGQSIYTIYCDMTLQFIADGWLKGNMFEGYWRDGLSVYASEPNLASTGQQFLYTTKKYPRGTMVLLGCEAEMQKTDNGFIPSGFSVRSEKIMGVKEISSAGINNTSINTTSSQNQNSVAITPSEIASLKPAFTCLFTLDTSQVILSLVFNSIDDELGKATEIKSKITGLLKSNSKIKEISSLGKDTANILTRYRLECNTKTFYNSSYSNFSKSNVYSADLRLSLYLWEMNKSGNVIKGTPSDNKVITTKTFLGGNYISKDGALDAVLLKIEEPLLQKFAAYFPIQALITEITDASKKGDPKKVKISCGYNQGVYKNFKFNIIDPSRKNEDYDLEVAETFDNYSICKVKENGSIIASRFNTKDKIGVTTNYQLTK